MSKDYKFVEIINKTDEDINLYPSVISANEKDYIEPEVYKKWSNVIAQMDEKDHIDFELLERKKIR